MAIRMNHACISIFTVVILLMQGCEQKDEAPRPTEAVGEIVCPQLYQGTESLADALAFVGVPEDRMASSRASVSKRGELADVRQLVFANKLFSVRESRDVELFKSLLGDEVRKQLTDRGDDRHMACRYLREIEDGTLLYGSGDFRFFATFRTMTPDDLATLSNGVSFSEIPTHAVDFCHFHRPKAMLIGTRFYLIEDGDSYRLVTGTLAKGVLPTVGKDEKSGRPPVPPMVSEGSD